MAIIDYDTWMKDSAGSALQRRSSELVAVDKAFLAFAKLGTPAAQQTLQNAFEAWKKKQGFGDEWKRSSRNRKQAASKLSAMLAGGDDNDGAFNDGRVPDFMHEELINARLGVLYLFSRVSVVPGLFKMVLEGGLDIAGQVQDISNASAQSKSALGHVTKAKGPLGALADKVEDKLVPQNTPRNVYLPQGAPPSILANAQATIVTSEQIERQAQAAEALANRPFVSKIRDTVQGWFDALVEKLQTMLREKFGTLSGISGTIKQLVKGIVTLVAAKAAPYVGAGMEIVSSLAKTVDAAITRFRAWKNGKGVEIGEGHPATVVSSITRAMTLSLFEGMYGTLKGAGALAMDAVGFGAGAVVNLIISVSEMLIKFVWRLVETVRINAFCKEARVYWEGSDSLDSLHRRPFAFSDWYRQHALNLPLIAGLTLNTGICGDKMRYLSMFPNGASGSQLSNSEFQRGVKFLDNLKPFAAKYISDSGFKIRTGGDLLVDNLVNTFALSHQHEDTAYRKVITVLTA